jgi:hypothetical protein
MCSLSDLDKIDQGDTFKQLYVVYTFDIRHNVLLINSFIPHAKNLRGKSTEDQPNLLRYK